MKTKRPHSKPILVTGAHRSGTTWVGTILAEARGVGIIHDPTNPAIQRAGVCTAHFSRHFTCISTENEGTYVDAFRRMLRFDFQYSSALKAIRTPKDVAKVIRDAWVVRKAGKSARRALIKDATALFTAEWLAHRFDAHVVIMVRHPAAFAGSLKRMNWLADFRDFLDQPLLMRDHLGPFEEELQDAVAQPPDLIGQAILLWRMLYYSIDRYRKAHPEWSVVRHEDISADPVGRFRELYGVLGLDYTTEIEQTIIASSSKGTVTVDDQRPHVLQRDSMANIKAWKKRLSEEEVARIREGTRDVAPLFYSDADW